MTLCTLQPADVFDLHCFLAIVKFNEFIIIGIALGVQVSLAVAVDAPAHRQQRVLLHDVHFLDRAMASLANDSTHVHML